jgi:succinate-semialdehyde dehydrogenase/glutarate-semialdehyde dehydrogenase
MTRVPVEFTSPLIGGEWRGDTDATIAVSDPTTRGVLAAAATSSVDDCSDAVDAASGALRSDDRRAVADPAAPFGGSKASGLGREGGFEGIDEYLERKYIGASW